IDTMDATMGMDTTPDTGLPDELAAALERLGVERRDEVSLRRALEARVPGYNLFRLTPAAARRWKCRYRILLDAGYYDGQTAAEAYARALADVLSRDQPPTPATSAQAGVEGGE
ncbi:MAG TPA: hypothetical protein VLJ14_07290, partial [Ktedonobacterales bacterium]|nr:hypothetical protein [Ktedonobacterales bacterium]